ncbi:MAG TPA: hypothetical protein DCE77_03485 [Methylophaga sp.]|nr:hypothetical protein [Methylophaga sp.]
MHDNWLLHNDNDHWRNANWHRVLLEVQHRNHNHAVADSFHDAQPYHYFLHAQQASASTA